MERTLFGYAVNLSLEADPDVITMHPDIFLAIENLGIRVETIVKSEPTAGSLPDL